MRRAKEFIGSFLAYRPGAAYLSGMLPNMGTEAAFCQNYGINKAAIIATGFSAPALGARLLEFVTDVPGVAQMQDERSGFYNKTKHGMAIVDSALGPVALELADSADIHSRLEAQIVGYDPSQARMFYNLTVQIAHMMGDLLLFHYLGRYGGWADFEQALQDHDAIVSITSEP
jgi:hypothetical protein